MSFDRKQWRELYYIANREKMLNRNKQYNKENRDIINDRRRGNRTVENLSGRYSLTKKQWDDLFMSQGNKCGICKTTEAGHPHGWNTDHDHETNKVRGILCHECNLALGYYEKKLLPILEQMHKYLKGEQNENNHRLNSGSNGNTSKQPLL
jgi:hypothetical protein